MEPSFVRRPRFRRLVVFIGILSAGLLGASDALASHGGSHTGTYTVWSLNETVGFNPQETVDDFGNLSNQIPGPVNITAMQNGALPGGPCGVLFWNPVTNLFRYVGVTSGFQLMQELNRSSTVSTIPAATFGGGDTWATVHGNSSFSPYVIFRGSTSTADLTADLRRWDGIDALQATGIRVNPANGKVYFGNFDPGQIIELDPATNKVRKWNTGSRPYFLVIDEAGLVYATAVSGGDFLDQIIRLDPTTNTVTRWDIPGGGLQQGVSFGTPNFVTRDLEGQVWFSESASDQYGRLNPVTNMFEEFTKADVDNPHGIASSGIGPTLQLFGEEADGNTTDVLTHAVATLSSTKMLVTPDMETITPETSDAMPMDFTRSVTDVTILPPTKTVESTNGFGIDRFPEPAFLAGDVLAGQTDPGTVFRPTSSTRVVLTNTIFGSVEGSNDVQQFVNGVMIAEPIGMEEEKVTGGYMYAVTGGAVTGGFNVQRKEASGPVTGELQYQNHASRKKIHLSQFTTLTCADGPDADTENDQCNFQGSGTVSSSPGMPVMCNVEVHDNNEPGNKDPKDTFKIDCNDGEMTEGELKGGNIQIHKSK